jgi:two-component system sensor histidine kinase UhpB
MRQSSQAANASSSTHLSLVRDATLVIALTLGAAFIAARFELSERLFSLTRDWEHVQLDEWPIALLVLALCLAWFAWQRYRYALREIEARQAAEASLSAALAENRRLAQQNVRMLEDERKHLARELHDELGQYLNAIKLDAVAFQDSEAGELDARTSAAERMLKGLDHIHAVVSDMIRRLRPVGLDELGLAAAVESCVDQWRQRSPHTRITLDISDGLDTLGEAANLTIYRLVQEGLTNSFKHAQARRIDVSLRAEREAAAQPESIVVRVSDDGRGQDSASASAGFGLGSMRERVELLGGTLLVESSAAGGFSFEARIPSASAQPA